MSHVRNAIRILLQPKSIVIIGTYAHRIRTVIKSFVRARRVLLVQSHVYPHGCCANRIKGANLRFTLNACRKVWKTFSSVFAVERVYTCFKITHRENHQVLYLFPSPVSLGRVFVRLQFIPLWKYTPSVRCAFFLKKKTNPTRYVVYTSRLCVPFILLSFLRSLKFMFLEK